LNFRGLRTLRRAAHWSRSRLGPRALVLVYHRVADSDWDPFSLCVSPQNFGQQLEVLRDIAVPSTLVDIVSALQEGPPPNRRVAVTFDDGYADNLHRALPLLTQADISATVFATTGAAGKAFWWDELARRAAAAASISNDIKIEFGEHRFVWQRTHSLSVSDRRGLVRSLARFMRILPWAQQHETLRRLDGWLRDTDIGVDQARSMTYNELRTIAESEHIEIGGHTVSHPLLERMPESQQRAEIADNVATLKSVTGRAVRSFAYPNGSYASTTPALVRSLGLSCACGMIESPVTRSSDLFEIPRLAAPNIGGKPFRRWLRLWLG
jgi:peptidoglycan/xylan/chitin deacetylase (PgdA/CDA1 family)